MKRKGHYLTLPAWNKKPVTESKEYRLEALEKTFGIKMIDGPKTQHITEICINIKARSCLDCPYVITDREYNYAPTKVHCTRMSNKLVCDDATFEPDMPPVPEWCPLRTDRKIKEKEKLNAKRFAALMSEDDE